MKRVLLVFGIMVFFSSTNLNAQVELLQAKAKFIYNFTKFFEWPMEERTGDFIIGVLGSSNMYNELNKFATGKKVTYQNIVVKKFKNADEVTNCHILFVSSYKSKDISGIESKTGQYTLIISDFKGAINKGSAINFVLVGNKLKYDFSSANTLKYGLKFSSKIQEMANENFN